MNAPEPAPRPETLPRWDLSDLYTGRDDPRIAVDLSGAEAAARALKALEGAFVAARADPPALGRLIADGVGLFETGLNRLWGVGGYAALAASVDHGDPGWARFEADVRTRAASIEADTLFFSLELNRLEECEIAAALAAHPAAARWSPWLRQVRAGRPHELSPELEHLLVDRAPAVANWMRLHDYTLARLAVRVGAERLTLSDALNRLSDPAPGKRRAAARGLATALARNEPTLALCFNTLADEKRVEDRWRRYASPAAARHLANEVDAEAVAALEAAVVEAYPSVSHRYYRAKAAALGRRALNYWDRRAPLSAAPPRLYGWDEAKALVLDSFAALSPRFGAIAADFLAHPWVDAEPRAGKQSGAFSHPLTAERHPYVFLNYMGERRDVLTLAHELGHAVHQTLAAPHGTLLAHTPLTLAETASIFGESLVFERLLAEARPAERRELLAGRIEDALDSVVRQIAFHRFETRFHAERARGEVAPEAIGRLWLEVMGESLGPAVRLNRGYEHYWAYVSHFVHSPFYVYAYAFGNLLVEALIAARAVDPAGFVSRYEALLSAGGIHTCAEALVPFGLDPRQHAFWASGCAHLSALVDAFEALV